MMAVLGNAKHPEYGSATVPLPIPNDKYGHVMELLDMQPFNFFQATRCEQISKF